jgi:hypothetical protein
MQGTDRMKRDNVKDNNHHEHDYNRCKHRI